MVSTGGSNKSNLNKRQNEAVNSMVNFEPGYPYILIGPPGKKKKDLRLISNENVKLNELKNNIKKILSSNVGTGKTSTLQWYMAYLKLFRKSPPQKF